MLRSQYFSLGATLILDRCVKRVTLILSKMNRYYTDPK